MYCERDNFVIRVESHQSPSIRPRAPGLSHQCSQTPTSPHNPLIRYVTICIATVCIATVCTEQLPGVQLRYFSTTCAVHMEDCDGWWLSGCLSSVVEHLWLQPKALGSVSSDCQCFTSHQLSLQLRQCLSLSAAGAQVCGQKEARICECG